MRDPSRAPKIPRLLHPVEGGVVKYRKNGTLFYTSLVAPAYPLLVDTAMLDMQSTVNNVMIFVP